MTFHAALNDARASSSGVYRINFAKFALSGLFAEISVTGQKVPRRLPAINLCSVQEERAIKRAH